MTYKEQEAAKRQPIAMVIGPEPMREGEYPSVYMVGTAHGAPGTVPVHRIAYREENYGDHGIAWFDVYAGEKRVASMSARHVVEVRYLDDSAGEHPNG